MDQQPPQPPSEHEHPVSRQQHSMLIVGLVLLAILSIIVIIFSIVTVRTLANNAVDQDSHTRDQGIDTASVRSDQNTPFPATDEVIRDLQTIHTSMQSLDVDQDLF